MASQPVSPPPQSADRPSPQSRRAAAWPALALSAAAIATVGAALAWFAARDPLRRAWAAADGRAYSVAGGTEVDVDGQRVRYSVAGSGDGRGALAIGIAALAPNGAAPALTASFAIAWPEVRAADGITLPQRALGVRLPVGDPLILLATAHAPRPGGLEPVGARLCRRIDFVLGARAYGTWWEAHPRYLPVNANAGGLWTFEGSGTAWIEPTTSLPCRIVAEVALPRLGDDVPGRGRADWMYAWEGVARAP